MAIHWFRNDLRLADKAALNKACERADLLAFLYVVPADERPYRKWISLQENLSWFMNVS